MKPYDIEAILMQLENGEISEDDFSENEDDIDYYSSQRDLKMEVEDEDDVGNSPATDIGLEVTSPLVNESSEIQHLGIVEQSPTPLVNNYMCNPRNVVWRVKNMDVVQNAFKFKGNIECSSEILSLETPFQFFSYFFNEELLKFLVEETNKYAFQKNPNFTEPITVSELRKFIGILIFTSVYHYPSVRSYWSNIAKFEPISQTMNRNRFDKIRQIFHMNDDTQHLPSDHPQHDRLHKVRPVLDHLNKKFITVPFDHRLPLDEQMYATKIKYFMKPYLPNKPHKWGFKLYVLCSLSGYAYSFEVYSGAKDKDVRRARAVIGGRRFCLAKMSVNKLKCTSCNLVISEVLAFIRDRHHVVDNESLIKICESAFSEEEIDEAKKLLFVSSKTTKKLVSRRKNKKQKDLEDMM